MGIKVIGLTGGIATGKSTVSGMLRAEGVPIVDADLLAREAVEPGSPALEAIAKAFGPSVLCADGTLDRARLGELIFAEPQARARLNAIVHPVIMVRSKQALDVLAASGHAIAVYDAALILENGLGGAMDGLMVVWVPEELQMTRLQTRDGITAEVARQRIAAQMPMTEKVARADWVIDNSGTLDETRRRVAVVWAEVRRRFGEERA